MCVMFVESHTYYKSSLRDHIQAKHMGMKFVCADCHKVFEFKNGLKNHMRVHDENYQHLCPHCSKGFVYKSQFDAHVA